MSFSGLQSLDNSAQRTKRKLTALLATTPDSTRQGTPVPLSRGQLAVLRPQQLNFGDEIQYKVEQRRTRWDSGIGYQDRDIFEAFLKLPIHQRKLIREVSLTFAKVHSDTSGPTQ